MPDPPTALQHRQLSSDRDGLSQGEPTIVFTGRQIVVVWMQWDVSGARAITKLYYSLSNDAGQSFSKPRPVLKDADPLSRYADPSLVAREGVAHLAFLKCPPNANCEVHRTQLAGEQWETPEKISGEAKADRPWVAHARKGLAWTWVVQDAKGRRSVQELQEGASVRELAIGAASFNPPVYEGNSAWLLTTQPDPRRRNFRLLQVFHKGSKESRLKLSSNRPERLFRIPISVGAIALRKEPDSDGRLVDEGGVYLALPRTEGGLDLYAATPMGTHAMEPPAVGKGVVTMPWLLRVPDGAVLAWLEKDARGTWQLMASCIAEDYASEPAVLGEQPFQFNETGKSSNIGDFLSMAPTHKGHFWIAYADVRNGDSAIRVVEATCPP